MSNRPGRAAGHIEQQRPFAGQLRRPGFHPTEAPARVPDISKGPPTSRTWMGRSGLTRMSKVAPTRLTICPTQVMNADRGGSTA